MIAMSWCAFSSGMATAAVVLLAVARKGFFLDKTAVSKEILRSAALLPTFSCEVTTALQISKVVLLSVSFFDKGMAAEEILWPTTP